MDLLLREVELKTSIDHTHADIVAVEQLASRANLKLSRPITDYVNLDQIDNGLRILERRA